VEETKMMVLLF